jgi:hypothetical protein
MDLKTFEKSLADAEPPQGVAGPLLSLWHAGKDEWEKAHDLVQDDESAEAAWVHAHLHRVEGDEGNAGYWYRRAKKPHAKVGLKEEWAAIASALLMGGK